MFLSCRWAAVAALVSDSHGPVYCAAAPLLPNGGYAYALCKPRRPSRSRCRMMPSWLVPSPGMQRLAEQPTVHGKTRCSCSEAMLDCLLLSSSKVSVPVPIRSRRLLLEDRRMHIPFIRYNTHTIYRFQSLLRRAADIVWLALRSYKAVPHRGVGWTMGIE